MVLGTLALGIGASTFAFSLVDGVLLRNLPYQEPGELVGIWETRPQLRDNETLGYAWDRGGLTWTEFHTLRDGSRAFEEVAVFRNRKMTLSGSGLPEMLDVGEASPALFPCSGSAPRLAGDSTVASRALEPPDWPF
jgi:putative ABC transport system permease protein